MRRIDLLSGIFGCLILLASCSQKDIGSPIILFINPEMSSYHDVTTNLNVEIDISDDVMVENYRFWIDLQDDFELFMDEKTIMKANFKILYQFDLSTIKSDDINLNIEVYDSDGNHTHKSMNVQIK